MDKKEKRLQLRKKLLEIQKKEIFKNYSRIAVVTIFSNMYYNLEKGYLNLVEKFTNKYL